VIRPELLTTPTAANAIELDVAIVGAGPAGTAAALELGGHGLRVGIIEKAVPPRHKTCGGGVQRRAAALLPIDLRAAVERECHAAELVHHAPALRFICARDRPIISMVMARSLRSFAHERSPAGRRTVVRRYRGPRCVGVRGKRAPHHERRRNPRAFRDRRGWREQSRRTPNRSPGVA
jgi:choline dehydrogenase-like flavoprotein